MSIDKLEAPKPCNPWRESLENCISGDNYLRTSEYHELIEYIDFLLAELAAATKNQPGQDGVSFCGGEPLTEYVPQKMEFDFDDAPVPNAEKPKEPS